MFWIMMLGFIVLVALAVIIATLPSSSTSKAKKKAKELKLQMNAQAAPADAGKDWQAIAHRWEKNNNDLLGELEKIKMQQKELEKQLTTHKTHDKDLIDKLSQEKSWREKEQINLDKAKAHEKELKAQIMRTEADLEKEHSTRIRLEQQLNELKSKFDAVQEEKRTATTKASSLETTLAQANKDIKELRQQNTELARRKEDIQWVAKSDYEELKKQMKVKEEEIARLKGSSAAS